MSTQETFIFPLEFNRLSLSQEDWIKGYRRLDDPHLGRQAAQKQHSYKNISQTNKSNNSHSQNRKSAPWHSAHTALRICLFFFLYSATRRKFLQLNSSIRKQVMTRHLQCLQSPIIIFMLDFLLVSKNPKGDRVM